MKKLLIVMLALMLMPNAFAAVIVPYVHHDMGPSQSEILAMQMRNDCLPPREFAQTHSCKLAYTSSISYKNLVCDNSEGRYYLTGDCKGDVTNSRFVTTEEWKDAESINSLAAIFAVLFVISLILCVLIVMKYFDQKGDRNGRNRRTKTL